MNVDPFFSLGWIISDMMILRACGMEKWPKSMQDENWTSLYKITMFALPVFNPSTSCYPPFSTGKSGRFYPRSSAGTTPGARREMKKVRPCQRAPRALPGGKKELTWRIIPGLGTS